MIMPNVRILPRWTPYPLAFVAGLIAVAGFHPFELWFAPFLSLFLAVIVMRSQNFQRRILLGYLYGLGFLAPLLHWSSTYVGSIPWLILSLGFALFYTFMAFGFSKGRVSILTFAALFAYAESLRAILPFGGFGWGRFGFSQLGGPLQEWLRIGGVAITGFMVALVAALVSRWSRQTLWTIPIISVGLLGVAPASAATSERPIRVGLIQGGVSQLGLDFNATPEEVFNRHLKETERLLETNDVDLILWPENASDIDPITNSEINARLNELAKSSSTPMIIGAVTQGASGPENVSLMFDGGGEVVSRYQKRDLVPFGEYMPLRTLATMISPLAQTVRDFVPGKSIDIHDVGGTTFAPLICYEILDDRVTWDNLERSNLGVVQTNNATFGRSWQSGQQFQMTRVRAYESQIPFIVAATTGDTASIDEDGSVMERIPKFQSASLVIDVSPRTPTTPPISPEATLYCLTFFLFLRIVSRSSWRPLTSMRRSDT